MSIKYRDKQKNPSVFTFKSVFQLIQIITRAKKRVKTDTVQYLCQYFMIRNTQYEVVRSQKIVEDELGQAT